MRALAPALVVLLLTFACDGDPDSDVDAGPPADAGLDGGGAGRDPCGPDGGPMDAGSASGLTNVCAEGLIMSGFGLRWSDEARQVARLGMYPTFDVTHFPEGCPPTSTLRGADLVARLDDGTAGGDGTATATYAVVGAGEGGVFPDGGLDGGAWLGLRTQRGAARLELQLEEGAAAASLPQLFDLALASMADAPAVAVVLDGFEIDTDVAQGPGYPPDYDPARGYLARGFGVSVGEVRREGDDLRFSVGARFATGRAGEADHDAARLVAEVEVVVHYLVVALPVAPTLGAVSYREQHRGHGRDELEVCRPDAATTALTLNGPPLPRAAPALTRFDFALYEGEAPEGDRLRELSARVESFAYDPATGEATMRVEGYASNAGPPPPRLPMDYAFEAEVALLQWEETGEVRTLRLDAPVAAGRTEIPVPLTPR